MSTPLSENYELVRALLGDFHATHKRYSDTAIASVLRTVVRIGELPGYTLGNDNVSITPTIATPRDLAILGYKAALKLLLPNAASYAYETRALKERFGEQALFVTALQEAIYDTENGAVFGSFQSFYAWVNGMTGLNLYGQLTEVKVASATGQITVAASPNAVSGSAEIDPGDPDLPVLTISIAAHQLGAVPTSINARVVVPSADADVFDCVLIDGWTSAQFQVRLLGLPAISGYKLNYTLTP